MQFDNFENTVMETILQEKTERNKSLLEQYRISKVISREFTGYGFYTDFEVSNFDLALPNKENLELGCLGNLEGIKNGAGFILFVRNGFIEMLEGYTYDEQWPNEVCTFTLYI